jgi:hypothetical protein
MATKKTTTAKAKTAKTTTAKTTTPKDSTKKTATAKATSAKTTTPKNSTKKTTTAKATTAKTTTPKTTSTKAKSTTAKTTTPKTTSTKAKSTTTKTTTPKAASAKNTKKSTTTAKKATTKTTSKTAKADIKIYQLKITLKGVRPPIWRRVLVKSNTTFDQLHFIIQRSMDWNGSHLYGWEVKGKEYTGQNTIFAELGFLDDEEEDNSNHEFDETEIGKIIGEKVNTKFVYIYDFGDNWEHEILVEEILPVDPKIKKYPVCITGKRAAPPDDCGGSWGYQQLLEILKDPEHPEYEEYMDWVEEDFDPEYCNLEQINIRLTTLDL